MSRTSRPRLLLVLAECRGGQGIRQALAQVPAGALDGREVEAFAVSDNAAGHPPAASRESGGAEACPFAVTTVPVSRDQGCGGVRKLGFQFALDRGFDAVAVLTGLGPAAFSCLPEVLERLDFGRADGVLASPMRGKRKPRRSVLTRIQNRLIGAQWLDYRSVCRAYAVDALRRVPFRLNSDGAAFDTEILIQFLSAGLRIEEVPVAPGPGDVRCRGIGGLKDARALLGAGVRARAQQWSLFHDRKFDCVSSAESNAHYKPRLGFESAHTLALARVPAGSRVLDIGCAGGYLGRALRARGCRVTGVDRLPLDPGCELDAFTICDFNNRPFPADLAGIDVAVMLDVIEHLASPEAFVDDFMDAAASQPGVTLIASTGNVAFAPIRLMLLAGQFNYGKRGILDLTHTRLFTFGTFRRLFEQAGFEVLELRGIPAPFPLALGHGALARALLALNKALVHVSRSLFAFQILAVVRPRPALAHLIHRADGPSEHPPATAMAAPDGSGGFA